MIKREYSDTDGACFAQSVFDECKIMDSYDDNCNTYNCPFYKPEGCKDWIKIETEDGVCLYAPEELEINGKENQQ